MIRRGLLAALLVYVALDLSLPDMPGAFVFDPAGSVDSIDAGRARLTGRIVLPIPAVGSLAPFPLARGQESDRPRPASQIARPPRTVVSCLPRGACAPARPSEDPH